MFTTIVGLAVVVNAVVGSVRLVVVVVGWFRKKNE
jgi:hypothetical protein